MSSSSDPERVFNSRAEAEAVRDKLNEDMPEHGYSPWYLGTSPGEERWHVIRARGVMAEDLTQTAGAYEEQFRAAVERASRNDDRWRDAEDIRIEDVCLEGSYPETLLVVIFRPVTSRPTQFGASLPACRFGIRWPIWPAEYDDPEHEARFHDVYFGEHLGTEPKAYLRLRGVEPCDPDEVNWLE